MPSCILPLLIYGLAHEPHRLARQLRVRCLDRCGPIASGFQERLDPGNDRGASDPQQRNTKPLQRCQHRAQPSFPSLHL
jgi:hypothetical protein